MADLSIHDALAIIHNSMGEFELDFISEKSMARKVKRRVRLASVPKRQDIRQRWAQNDSFKKQERNRAHTLLLFDIEENHPFSVKIPLIMGLNGISVRHGKK
jgi:hypothetical protein